MSRSSLRRWAGPAIAGSLALVGSALPATVGTAHAAPDSPVFINELHDDNTGTDAGESVEIAGPAGTDLTGWSVVLHNGGNNAQYDSDRLSGVLGRRHRHRLRVRLGRLPVQRPPEGFPGRCRPAERLGRRRAVPLVRGRLHDSRWYEHGHRRRRGRQRSRR